MNSTVKTIMFWAFILVCLMLLWTVVQRSSGMTKSTEIGYSDLLSKIDEGQVQDATIQGNELHGHMKGVQGRIPYHDSGEHRQPDQQALCGQGLPSI